MTRDFTKGLRTGYYVMLFVMGAAFWIATETDNFVMLEAVYGAQALAYPAVWWAACMMLTATTYLVALAINGRGCWTPYVRIACGFLMSSYFSLFTVSAWPASGGDMLVIASGVLSLKAASMTYIDARELAGQWSRQADERN
jgi:hypothetical protein